MSFLAKVSTVLWALGFATSAAAQFTTSVIDIPHPTGSQRILLIEPFAPQATILMLPGGQGFLDISDDGRMFAPESTCGPYSRQPTAFPAIGISIAFVNRMSDGGFAQVVQFLRARRNVPVWITGGSSSTAAAANVAASIPQADPTGLILFAPQSTVSPSLGASIAHPAFVIYHAKDGLAFGQEVYDRLTAAPARQLKEMTGGNNSDCGGFHLFRGLDKEFVDAVSGFIGANNAALGGLGPVPGEVIEYFHAGFGHYFTTALAAEIALLDGGAFDRAFVRTGRGYRAWAAAEAGTEPVCRFFTVTFAPKSSHFYTAYPFECDIVKTNPDWQYEGTPYYSRLPVGGACAVDTVPVYRMFNNGLSGAPNHRFTTDLALYTQFTTTLGWAGEGVVFCAKP